MRTLLLTRSDTEALLEPESLLADVRAAFRGYSLNPDARAQRVRSALPGPGTATVLFPGTAAGIPAYTVKVHAKFPEQQPAIRGVLCLHDGQTGDLLAVMNSTHLTAVRTGLCSALAADVLARHDARSVAVIGAGMQGEHQLRSLHLMRPIGAVRVYDTAQDRAAAFAERMRQSLGLAIEVSDSVVAAVNGADMVFAATWARTPFILPGMLQPGAHVSTIGADEPGKCEVSAEVIRDAVFVCDDRDLAVSMGAIGGAKLGADAISAELGEVIGGSRPGRVNGEQITIYGGVGLAFQDAVAAWHIYRVARSRGLGRELDFLG
ncbi:MAG TPA: ornithine cyclodeaminase family protein [Verrucomicrobiae bacterium]|nr:ornithine cyclodeaminase family protein [Verrucomicrobiae bacterium]